jgi:predicted nucleic acid-binding protein
MISGPLPSDIYIDTSLAVATMFPGLPHSEASRIFCSRLGNQGGRIYFSQLLLADLANALRNLATRDFKRLPESTRLHYQLDQWTTSDQVRRTWMQTGVQQWEAFLAQFEEAIELPLRSGTWQRSLTLLWQHDLKSNDALHVATAIESGLQHFAAVDREFSRVRDLQLWLIRDSVL